MTIDWMHFTPWHALAGGLLIGLAAALFILFNGKIAGISGILGGLLRPVKGDVLWRITFLLGLMISPLVFALFRPLPEVTIEASNVTLVIAGLLVGLGTRYGAGCTSGHGVCGLSRLSLRSLVATLAFMVAGFLTVYIVRHLIV
ncbi:MULTISPECIES: YeeE/YedE family protein [Oxalobacteraceae]|uniref:YeeE/YedE family protein n=1 Tax=Herminiimonas sp. Marseille-P9896 TaxID=2742211 RepID=UPI001589C34C|nr:MULTISPECIES: YeeE/YedE family protein [Oxalobacteraceae]